MSKKSSYKFQCEIRSVFPDSLSTWMKIELRNVYEWNQSIMRFNGVTLECPEHWKITAIQTGIFIESNRKFCSPRKGIRFNVEKGLMQIS